MLPQRRRTMPAPPPADEFPEPGQAGGRRAYPEPERPRRADERRRTYREPGSDTEGRSWHIPDEPWRGTEVPWRGPDGEYHTGQIPAITDDEPDGQRRPDLTVIAGGADVREYESDYEGRDVAPLRPEEPYDEGQPPQPRSRHLKAVPGEPYGR